MRLPLRSEALAAYLMVGPALLVLLVFVLLPAASVVLLSFTDWNGIAATINLTGLRNYVNLLNDPVFQAALRNTIVYTAGTLPLVLVVGLGAALLVEKQTRTSGVLRAFFMAPFVVSIAVVAIIWTWLLEPNFGILNYGLGLIGLGKQQWVQSPGSAMAVLIAISIWRQFGYYMLIFLAGLKSIDQSLYEAAAIDGAGYWRSRWHITFPLLGPQLFFALIIGAIDSFQVFAMVDLITRGGPINSTNVVVYYMYQQGFQFFNMGLASAVSVVLVVWIAALTVLQIRVVGRRVFYQ